MNSRPNGMLRFFVFVGIGAVYVSLLPRLAAQANYPFVESVNNAADYKTTIAQGSLFVVFGTGLGPATLTEISALPLPPQLAGTQVTVTSGNTKLTCPMIYTSAQQIAAILPSNTP